jgi:hypothetical protein
MLTYIKTTFGAKLYCVRSKYELFYYVFSPQAHEEHKEIIKSINSNLRSCPSIFRGRRLSLNGVGNKNIYGSRGYHGIYYYPR